MKTTSALLALAAVSPLLGVATSLVLEERGTDPQFSFYAKCIQEELPSYPFSNEVPTAQKVGECFERIETAQAATEKRSTTLNVETDFNSRSVPTTRSTSSIVRRNGDFSIETEPYCDSDKVNDNFIWVTDIRGKAVEFCERLIVEVEKRDIDRNGGLIGQVVNLFTNAHDKQGHQLKDNVKVLATFVLSFYPPANMALETVKEIARGAKDICAEALTTMATKGDGCTADLSYYRPSHAKGYTGTGAIGGLTEILWKGARFAMVKIDLVNA